MLENSRSTKNSVDFAEMSQSDGRTRPGPTTTKSAGSGIRRISAIS